MNWLRKKIYNWLRDHDECHLVSDSPSTRIESRGLNLALIKANGGWVIEFSQYDKKTDEVNRTVHIIPNDQELGESLSKIITYEMLSR